MVRRHVLRIPEATKQLPQGFCTLAMQLMASLLDPERLAKASLNNVAYAFTQIHQAGRLEQGKTTENIGVLSRYISQSNKELFGKVRSQAVGHLDETQAETVVSRPDIKDLRETV